MPEPRRSAARERRLGHEIFVDAYTTEEECMCEPFVLIGVAGRRLGVQIAQLDPVTPDKATREAVADRRYWQAAGYRF